MTYSRTPHPSLARNTSTTRRNGTTSLYLSMLAACLLVMSGGIGGCAATADTAANSAVANTTAAATENLFPLYELRTYTTNEGKLEALHTRFRDHTRSMFEKHGMQNVAYWVPVDKPNTLIYIIAHRNQDAAAASWKAFVEDPEWQAVYAASIADGRLVANIDNLFMNATDYSPALLPQTSGAALR